MHGVRAWLSSARRQMAARLSSCPCGCSFCLPACLPAAMEAAMAEAVQRLKALGGVQVGQRRGAWVAGVCVPWRYVCWYMLLLLLLLQPPPTPYAMHAHCC
jgi:hypothetical protein